MSALEQAIATLETLGDPQQTAAQAAEHKVDRPYFGVSNPALDAMSKDLRADLELDDRITLADALWQSNGHEPRVLAAKLLTQARLRPDDTRAWDLIASWVPDLDTSAIADQVCTAGQKRLVWEPKRIDQLEPWTEAEHMWTRRATLLMTLPWTKQNHPKPEEQHARDRILGWAALYTKDHDWFIQKAISQWLRELAKHDTARVVEFLEEFGDAMKPFARKEASRTLSPLL